MIKIHRKMVEEKEIIGDEIIIKECYEETEEFISLEQQISILKKAKTDKIYFRQNYENLIEFEDIIQIFSKKIFTKIGINTLKVMKIY